MRRRYAYSILIWAFCSSVSVAASSDTPMSYMRTYGPAGDPVTRLNYGLIAISIAVSVIIGVLVLIAAFRHRQPEPPDSQGRLPVGQGRGGMSWIYVGTGISAVVLLVCAVWNATTLSAVAAPHKPTALTIAITAHQWWWEAKYPGESPGQLMVTANEIHIPVGEPVRVKLDSDDVIHSFWIPQLAGKTDVIPGQTNYAWLQADVPGRYRGQCGEYCGLQHAHMALYVVAEDRNRFDAWRQQQSRDAPSPDSSQAAQGSAVFQTRCAVCHAVRGTGGTAGILGPDLTHLMGRDTIASGLLENNTGNLHGWIANPQGLKPGTRMPQMDLSPVELHATVAYLETLK